MLTNVPNSFTIGRSNKYVQSLLPLCGENKDYQSDHQKSLKCVVALPCDISGIFLDHSARCLLCHHKWI